jgi:hypothetical protein
LAGAGSFGAATGAATGGTGICAVAGVVALIAVRVATAMLELGIAICSCMYSDPTPVKNKAPAAIAMTPR